MDFFGNRYFRHVRFFLVLVGQWPYDHSKVKQLKRSVVIAWMLSYTIVQVSEIIDKWGDLDIVAQTLSLSMCGVIIGTKYGTCWIQGNLIRDIFERIKQDWDNLKSKHEKLEMEKHTVQGYLYRKTYIWLSIVGGITVSTLLAAPLLIDILVPMNSTHHRLPFQLKYFVDSEKYYYPILIHVQSSFWIEVIAMTASDMAYLAIMFHACGLFGVLSCKFEHLCDDMEQIGETAGNYVLCARIAEAVQYHCRIMKFIEDVEGCFAISFVLQFFAVILSLSSILYNIQKSVLVHHNVTFVLVFSLDLLAHYAGIFLNIIPAEKLIDSSVNTFYSLYNGYWYRTPCRTRKLLTLIMQKNLEPRHLTFYGVIRMSYEIITKVVQLSVSYFMMICTLQQ